MKMVGEYKRLIGWFCIVLFSVFIVGCAIDTAEKRKTESVIKKSTLDTRAYRYLKLDNGLKVVLVSDPTTEKAAAALDVAVGSSQDPDSRLGLAHFLEHMLFISSAKYPEVDGYVNFITANGGNWNAYTSSTNTHYFFDIKSDKLKPALDRFVQFFISPSFDSKYVDRERHAVHAEYLMKIKDDSRRLYQVVSVTGNPEHPDARFTVGNLDTLHNKDGKSLEADLKAFYYNYYQASNMALSVYGKESLNVLEKNVKALFGKVSSDEPSESTIDVPKYTSKELGKRLDLEPLRDEMHLELFFPFPDVWSSYKKSPLSYISNLLENKKEGSLFTLLRDRHWITHLDANTYNYVLQKRTELYVSLELTKKGLENIDEITALFFDYVDLIRKQGVKERLFDEFAQMVDLKFQYSWTRSPLGVVNKLASNMHIFPVEDILGNQKTQYDPELIKRCLDEIRPDNMRQIVIARGLKTDKIEPYYKTKYRISPISEFVFSRANLPQRYVELSIPPYNPYIPRDLALRSQEQQADITPRVILTQPGFMAWGLTDTSFKVPKGSVMINMTSPLASDTPEHLIHMLVFNQMLLQDESLLKEADPGLEGGLSYDFSFHLEGLSLIFKGYQDKQELFMSKMLPLVRHLKIEDKALQRTKDRVERSLKNQVFDKPFVQLKDKFNQIIYPNSVENLKLLQVMGKVSKESLQAYISKFFRQAHIEMMIYGNYSGKESMRVAKLVSKELLGEQPIRDVYRVPFNLLGESNKILEVEVKHPDSSIIMYHQSQNTNEETRAKYALLSSLISIEFFKQLRTDQQLGYVVNASNYLVGRKYPGLMFTIQSPKENPEVLEKRINAFLLNFRSKLIQFTKKELRTYKQGLITTLKESDNNFYDRSSRLWMHITTDDVFDIRHRIAKKVEGISLIELKDLLDEMIKKKHRVILRSWGEGKLKERKGKKEGVVYSVEEAKKGLRLKR